MATLPEGLWLSECWADFSSVFSIAHEEYICWNPIFVFSLDSSLKQCNSEVKLSAVILKWGLRVVGMVVCKVFRTSLVSAWCNVQTLEFVLTSYLKESSISQGLRCFVVVVHLLHTHLSFFVVFTFLFLLFFFNTWRIYNPFKKESDLNFPFPTH